MATIKLREYVSFRREYDIEITDADVGRLNLHLLEWTTEPFETITCEDVVDVFNGDNHLGDVQMRGRKYRVDLNDYVYQWFLDDLYNCDPWESDCDTDDTETEAYM